MPPRGSRSAFQTGGVVLIRGYESRDQVKDRYFVIIGDDRLAFPAFTTTTQTHHQQHPARRTHVTRLTPERSTCLPKERLIDCSEVHRLDDIVLANRWIPGCVEHLGQLPLPLLFELRSILASARLLGANHQALILKCLPRRQSQLFPKWNQLAGAHTGSSEQRCRFTSRRGVHIHSPHSQACRDGSGPN